MDSEFYKLFAPRVTILVTSADKDGKINAAPFSFAMPISFNPPMLAFSAAPQRHTLENIRETREFVVNIPSEEMLDKLWKCSTSYPKGVNELREAGLGEEKSLKVKPPRVKESVAFFECAFESEKTAGDHVIIIGEVMHAGARQDILNADGNLDVGKAKILLHLGGKEFALADRTVKAR